MMVIIINIFYICVYIVKQREKNMHICSLFYAFLMLLLLFAINVRNVHLVSVELVFGKKLECPVELEKHIHTEIKAMIYL